MPKHVLSINVIIHVTVLSSLLVSLVNSQPQSQTQPQQPAIVQPASFLPPSTPANNVPRPGTVVQLDTIDTVDVEASNKALAEQQFENEIAAKKHAANVVRLAATDQLNSEIVTNKTRAYLSCESGEMIVKINFSEPFRGVGYSDYDRSSPCKFYGDGSKYYELRMPLKGCGTKQEAPRIFINNIILRFHRSLELEEDEIKTIICRYPPPLAPPPPLIAAPILEQPPENAPFMPAHLSQVELILIVSALLFLTLLLLGIGMGYYCLKRRNIKVVRKVPPPPFIPPIPRASLSSSETFYESDFDDLYRTNQHEIDEDVLVTKHGVIVPPILPIDSQFYDDRYLTNLSTTSIEEDIEVGRWIAPKKPLITTIIQDDYYITPTTTTEVIEDVTTHRLIVPPEKPLTISNVDDLHRTDKHLTEVIEDTVQQRAIAPPVPTITTKNIDQTFITPEEETEIIEQQSVHRVYNPKQPNLTMKNLDDFYRTPEEETEVIEEIIDHRAYGPRDTNPQILNEDDYFNDVYEIDEFVDDYTTQNVYAPRGPQHTTQTVDDEFYSNVKEVEEYVDDTNRKVMAPKPKYVVKNIDDLYITNITESEISEHIIKTGRSMPNLTSIPDEEDDDDEPRALPKGPRTRVDIDEDETVIKSSFDLSIRNKPPKQPPPITNINTSRTTIIDEKYTKETIRIEKILNTIDTPPLERLPIEFDDLFPPPKRQKLRTVILTDEVFRTMIVESTTIEEYTERIVHHSTYGPMFEPPTWEVIFRLFTLPHILDDSILPSTNVRHFPGGSIRSYKSFKSAISGHEVRSVTEEDVNYSRTILTSDHFVPPPDYDLDPSDPMGPSSLTSSTWNPRFPDRGYELPSRDYSPVEPAFTSSQQRSVFGPNHRLMNPYEDSLAGSPLMRRRLSNFGLSRPYSPDVDALSLEHASSRRNYTSAAVTSLTASSSHRVQQQQQQQRYSQAASDDREEIKSTTETDIYDWKRYPRTQN